MDESAEVADGLVRLRGDGDSVDEQQALVNLRRKLFGEDPDPVRIGRFDVVGRIGAGASGVVFAGVDPQLDRRVAIKLLRREHTDDADGNARSRMLREPKILAKLSHPNIVTVYEVGEHEGRVYLAMEYIEGTTLTGWIAEGPHPWQAVVAKLVQAGRGLASAHAAGLVHRDFKPDNVLLDSDGNARVADFGLARSFAVGQTAPSFDRTISHDEVISEEALTATGALVGTPAYLAPELFSGADASPASDQFGFCVALDEALHGTRPFTGRTLAELATNIATQSTQPRSTQPLPRWLTRVLERGLSADPEHRYPSMDALVADLSRDRSVKRQVGLVGLGALGVAGVWFAAAEPTSDPCKNLGSAVDRTWDKDKRATVRAAFVATGHPEAETQFLRTATALDDYASGWTELSETACRAEDSRSDAMIVRQAMCLERARFGFEASVLHFETPSISTVGASDRLLPSTTALRVCASEEVLTAELVAQPAPAQRERLSDLERRIELARATRKSGHAAKAGELFAEMVKEAQEIGYAPTEARILYEYGATYTAMVRDREAVPQFQAAAVAADRGGSDFRRAEALVALSFKMANLKRVDEARDALRRARAAYARTGMGERWWYAQATLADAWIERDAGHHEAALALFKESAEAFRNGVDKPEEHAERWATALAGQALALWTLADYEGALTAYTEAHRVLADKLGATHPATATVLVNIGAAQQKLQRLELALATTTRSLEIRLLYVDETDPSLSTLYSNLGALAFDMGRIKEALGYFERSHKAAEAGYGAEHPTTMIALANAGTVHSRLGDYAAALEIHRRVLDSRIKTLGADHQRTAGTRAALGLDLLGLERPAEARTEFDRAIAAFEETLGDEHPDLVGVLVGTAQASLDLGEPALALKRALRAKSLSDHEAVTAVERVEMLFVLARATTESGGNEASALAYARDALALAVHDGPDGTAPVAAGSPELHKEIVEWIATHE